jgi:long-chain acyl-CoA synthetase
VISPFITDWVHAHARRDGDAPAIATPTARLSYRELATRFESLAVALRAAGVTPGERIVVSLPNQAATVVVELAIQAAGACVVEVNRSWGSAALLEIVERTGASRAFVSGRDVRMWAGIHAARPLRLWTVAADDRQLAVLAPDAIEARIAEDGRVLTMTLGVARAAVSRPQRDDAALIIFTSGSSGRPHGVVQTWANIDANTRSIVRYLGITAADRAMLVLPLSYCYGRSVLQTHLFAGGSVFLDDRFMYPRIVLQTIATEGCTGFAGVPATFELIRRQVDLGSLAPLPLRYVTQAGDAMAPETVRWARRAFAPASLFVMYGQTEATARLSYLPPEHADDKEGSIGIAIPGVELMVVDDAGVELPDGTVGNLIARGDNITPGYLDEPEETRRILRDGWLWTGDLAYRDGDGFLFHAGRSREILKVHGHRVSPAEIEGVIARHPDVIEAAVAGTRDDLVAAFVVLREGATVSEAALRRFCSEHLPVFKVPARVAFVAALPRGESGKIQRRRLEALPA